MPPPRLPPASVLAVRKWFSGRVEPARLPLPYRAGLLGTAIGMVMLPLLYLAVVAAVCAVGVLWARYGLFIFEHIRGLYGLVAYAAPLLAILFCVCFLLKPLFAPAPKRVPPVRVDLAKEPVLAEFIRCVTAAVGAPMPSVVEVDCAVNASAAFVESRGGFFRRRMTLTIGLPLAGGIEIGEFAALLAHEFGHFSQRAGMASSFLIRSVNYWLARVVHERDAWDRELEEGTQRGHWAGIAIAAFTQMAVFISRKLLSGLLFLGHAISSFQLRQMEYDADHYATQLAGTAAHLSLADKLGPLSRAHNEASAGLQALWTDRVLPADFPAFVADRREHGEEATPPPLPPTAQERWFSTHPTWEERTARIIAANAKGHLRTSGPATSLFTDFAGLCCQATAHFYVNQLGISLKSVDLLTVEETAFRIDADKNAQTEWERFAGQLLTLRRPLSLSEVFTPALEGALASEDRTSLHRHIVETRPQAQSIHEQWARQHEAQTQTALAMHLLSAGIGLARGTFGLEKGTPEEAAEMGKHRTADAEATAGLLTPLAETLKSYLAATVATAAAAPSHPRSGAIVAAAKAVVSIEPLVARIPGLLARWELAQLLATNAPSLRQHPAFAKLSLDSQRSLIAAFNATMADAKKIRDPFRKDPPAGWTFADHLRSLLPQQAAAIETRASALLGGLAGVHRRLLAAIHYHGLGLPPGLALAEECAPPPLLKPEPAQG